jgi:hypothetical protein
MQPMQPQRGGDDFAPRNMIAPGQDMAARRMQMQQARNRSQMASAPAPTFTQPSYMGERVTTVQGSEIGRPDLQGPQVMFDYGGGQYGYGTDPNDIRRITGQYGKFFT